MDTVLNSSSLCVCSQLRFIILKECKAKSAKRRGTWDRDQRKPGVGFQDLIPLESLNPLKFLQPQIETTGMKCCLPGELIKTQWSGFLLGVGRVGTCCQNSRLLEGGQVFRVSLTVGTMKHSCWKNYFLVILVLLVMLSVFWDSH